MNALIDSYTVDHTQVANLPGGLSISLDSEPYIIAQKLGVGGEGISYLGSDGQGKMKVLKFVATGTSTTASELEQKLTEEFRQINTALHTNFKALRVNPIDVVTIADFIEGRNLEEEVKAENRVFSEAEVVDCLTQIAQQYLKPLHAAGLVHRDIKPQNIICNASIKEGDTSDNHQKTYSLIDFGLLRKEGPATITINLKGTLGYTRIKENWQYEAKDDLYALAKTAYFLLTGTHPEFIGNEKYDAMHDKDVFGKLNINPKLKAALFRMLGHNGDKAYSNLDELVGDLAGVEKKTTAIDLASARNVAEYKESTLVPATLQACIQGLQEIFAEKYSKTLPERNPLDDQFKQDLEEVLLSLGYQKQEIQKTIVPTYVRKRKDDDDIEILKVGATTDTFFSFYIAASEKECEAICTPFTVNHTWYDRAHAASISLVGGTGLIGLMHDFLMQPHADLSSGLFLGAIVMGIVGRGYNYSNYPTRVLARGPEKSYFSGIPLLNYPHVIGKACHDLINRVRKNCYYANDFFDEDTLEEALQPAPHFTYKQLKE